MLPPPSLAFWEYPKANRYKRVGESYARCSQTRFLQLLFFYPLFFFFALFCSFLPFFPYLGAIRALLSPPGLSRAVPTTGQVSGHQTTITTTGTRWPWWWRSPTWWRWWSPPLALTPPLTGGTTTQCVSGGTITVQEVAVVFCNYQHHHQHFHSKAVQSNKHLQVLSTTRWSHSCIELQIYRHRSEILYFLL